jgi:hypothetical protein
MVSIGAVRPKTRGELRSTAREWMPYREPGEITRRLELRQGRQIGWGRTGAIDTAAHFALHLRRVEVEHRIAFEDLAILAEAAE